MIPTAQQIIEAVAEASELEIHQVKAGTKRAEHVRARWAAMMLIRELTGMTSNQAARSLKLINHTTITHGIKQCKRLQSESSDYANMILDARQIALEKAAGLPCRPTKMVEAMQVVAPVKIQPCLNVVAFRPKREGPKAWLTIDGSGEYPRPWYDENDARFSAWISVVHPEMIVWDFERRA